MTGVPIKLILLTAIAVSVNIVGLAIGYRTAGAVSEARFCKESQPPATIRPRSRVCGLAMRHRRCRISFLCAPPH